MNDIKVSIITVCYNSENTVKRTIKSVFDQTYKNIEYIIVDGKSTDRTNDIIRDCLIHAPIDVKYVSENDEGIYDAMNKGIKMSSGGIIGIVNSDDYYEKDAVENIVAKYRNIKNQSNVILYGFERNLLRGKEIEIVFYHHHNLCKKNINHPTCFVSRSVYEDIGLFNTKYRSSADYDFILRAFLSKKVMFIPVYKIISNFELGGTSLSGLGISEAADILHSMHLISMKEYILRKMWAKIFFLKQCIIMR